MAYLCELAKRDDVLVIVMVGAVWLYEEIRRELESCGLSVIHVDEVLGRSKEWDGKILKRDYPDGIYTDTRGNSICFDETLPDKIRISLVGCNNKVSIGKNLVIGFGNLYIRLGNNGICQIGKNTEIVGANAVTSSEFGEKQIIVGSPARCIRENICWSKDDTDYFNWECLEECKCQEALKYV